MTKGAQATGGAPSNKGITKQETDYSKWYTDIVLKAELADYAPVRGCMVIRPNGYAIWEKIQSGMDKRIKETGHKNLYFPLLIPESFFKKEAEHVEGFAPECAVVTHGGGKELEEPLYIRPTSETIIWHMYKNWISSYRDLPLLFNQWANVVRWEMRTRLFLRTTEFLWQEGHTAHATEKEAREETLKMLEMYREFCETVMAMPVVCGQKTENEKFAGAVATYSIEALMQDGKALQGGTSHYLGENFAKAFDVKFQDKDGQLKYVFATSWGATTRLIGSMIMTHSDNQGLVLPPALATTSAVVIPIAKSPEERETVLAFADTLVKDLRTTWGIEFDTRDDLSPGWKFNEWELKGIPVRIEIGPRDVQNQQVVFVRRDTREKAMVPIGRAKEELQNLLDKMQRELLAKAKKSLADRSFKVDSFDEFKERVEGAGGFLYCHWCGDGACEKAITEETKATIRNIPFDSPQEQGKCIRCEGESHRRVIFAKAY